jgi:hypothetical protein
MRIVRPSRPSALGGKLKKKMRLIKRLSDWYFYNPYDVVAQSKHVVMGRSRLGPTFRLRLDCPRQGVAHRIGDNCLLHSHFIFESAEGGLQ